jgi:hypothetical protein
MAAFAHIRAKREDLSHVKAPFQVRCEGGGVLGDVSGDRIVGQLAVSGDRADVGLVPSAALANQPKEFQSLAIHV